MLMVYRSVVSGNSSIRSENQVVIVPSANADSARGNVHLVAGKRALVEMHDLLRYLCILRGLTQNLKFCLSQLHHETDKHLETAMRLQVEKGSRNGAQILNAKAAVD